MVGFIIRILGNVLALYAANLVVPGFVVKGGIKEYLIAGVVLGLLNLIVRPALKWVTTPIIIISLGLFIIVINALMLWLVSYIFTFVVIGNLIALVWATIIVGLVNILVAASTKIID